MNSQNPIFGGGDAFSNEAAASRGSVMTVQGAVNRTFVLAVIVLLMAAVSWNAPGALKGVCMIGGAIGGLVACLAICFKKSWSPVLAPVYAGFEGVFLGALSSLYAAQFHGIVGQALLITFGILFGMLGAYQVGLIRATETFRAVVVSATIGVALVYLASMVLGIFGVQMPFLHDSGPIGIVISLVIVGIAAMNLVLDFDMIETGAAIGSPKYMEWYAAFGLMVTIIWLYVEVLRLLSKFRSR